jgi:hypothetical protein
VNRQLLTAIIASAIRHAITVYGGSKLLSGDNYGLVEGAAAIIVALFWSYLEKMKPKVDAQVNDKET